jgi:hypothetical protein
VAADPRAHREDVQRSLAVQEIINIKTGMDLLPMRAAVLIGSMACIRCVSEN